MKITVENVVGTKVVEATVKQMQEGTISKGACIRNLFLGGLDVKEIVTATGIKYNHVYNVVSNHVVMNGLDVVKTGRSGGKKDKVIELLKSGKTLKEAAAETQSLYNYVWKIAKDAGLLPKKKEEKVEEAPVVGAVVEVKKESKRGKKEVQA